MINYQLVGIVIPQNPEQFIGLQGWLNEVAADGARVITSMPLDETTFAFVFTGMNVNARSTLPEYLRSPKWGDL